MILICYDGSADSKAAIAEGPRLLGGGAATVLTVWEPFIDVLARTPTGFGISPAIFDEGEIDKLESENAEKRAREGVELARQAGFEAQPRTRLEDSSTYDAILSEAKALDATAILMGSRGLTGLKSLLLGSVSHGVIQHADRTVIIVPSPEVAASRRR